MIANVTPFPTADSAGDGFPSGGEFLVGEFQLRVKVAMHFRSKIRFFVALSFLLAMPAIGLQGQNIAVAKQGITRLKALPGSVQQVQQVIKGTNFGPFKTSGRCFYNWQWYCFFSECNYYDWWWTFPGYTWLKTDLETKYNRVRDQASQFDAAFSPVKTWLVISLPAISKQMETTSARMQVGDAVRVQGAIAELDAALGASARQLEVALQNLSVFNGNLNALLQQASSRDGMENAIGRDQAELNQKLVEYPCGADEARSQYNAVRNTVRGQFDQVAQASKNFGVTSTQTDQDVSVILGTLLAVRGRVSTVVKNLKNASVTPAGAVQELHLDVAASQWRDLALYAQQQLGN